MTTPQAKYKIFLETLTAENLNDLSSHVTHDVHFKDPFNDVHGIDAMQRVFNHMFKNVKNLKFEIQHSAIKENVFLMAWRLNGDLAQRPWIVDGASIVFFDSEGRVTQHIDHWDAAQNFYERLPLIGWLIGYLRSRIALH